MNVEWFRNARGRRASHAKVDGDWACHWARLHGATLVDRSPRTSLGHVVGEVCAHCAVEVNARAVIARDEARREARSE